MRAPLALCTLALTLSTAATACGQAPASGGNIGANYVAATDQLHTAGQPDAAALATLAEQGFELVVNLAPPSNQTPSPTRASSSPRTARPTSTSPSLAEADVRGLRAVQRRDERRTRSQGARALPAQHARVGVHVPLPRRSRKDVPPEEAMKALSAVWIPRDQWADVHGRRARTATTSTSSCRRREPRFRKIKRAPLGPPSVPPLCARGADGYDAS